MRIRYKSPKGNGIMTLDDEATVENLALQTLCEMGTEHFEVRYGWPSKPLDLSAKQVSLASLKMNGETITIVVSDDDDDTPSPSSSPAIALNRKGRAKEESKEVVVPWSEREGVLVLRVMPDDNSCLFTAFGGVFNLENPSDTLRSQVSSYILSNPDKYTDVVLEMSPQRYCDTIMHPDRWGGAIELGILCELHDIEICSVDVKTGRIDRYGEGKEKRCILCYSGIHYDRITFSFAPPPFTTTNMPLDTDVTNWSTDDDQVLLKAVELSEKLKGMNYYTDTTTFVLKCDVPGCNWVGAGESDAIKHMESTGHQALSEMKIT